MWCGICRSGRRGGSLGRLGLLRIGGRIGGRVVRVQRGFCSGVGWSFGPAAEGLSR
jgi:hypothetical protein